MITKLTVQLYELTHDILNKDKIVILPGGTRFALFSNGKFWQVRWGLADGTFCMFLTCEVKLDLTRHRLIFPDLAVKLWQDGSPDPSPESEKAKEMQAFEQDSCGKVVQSRIVPTPSKTLKTC